ncbi:MAG: hypothetical protein AB7P76_07945 [Candidatus Melainabacteria bacterium]
MGILISRIIGSLKTTGRNVDGWKPALSELKGGTSFASDIKTMFTPGRADNLRNIYRSYAQGNNRLLAAVATVRDAEGSFTGVRNALLNATGALQGQAMKQPKAARMLGLAALGVGGAGALWWLNSKDHTGSSSIYPPGVTPGGVPGGGYPGMPGYPGGGGYPAMPGYPQPYPFPGQTPMLPGGGYYAQPGYMPPPTPPLASGLPPVNDSPFPIDPGHANPPSSIYVSPYDDEGYFNFGTTA